MEKEPEEDRSAMMTLGDGEGREGRRELKAPQIETIQTKFKSLKEIKEELAKKKIPAIDELFLKFRKDEDMKKVFIAVILNPVSRYGELELDEEFKSNRKQAYRKLDLLKSLELIKFLPVMEIRDKKLKKEKLDEEEKSVLKKWGEWSKSMTDKQKKMYMSKTNYYAPTERGKDIKLLNFLVNIKYEQKEDFR
ncbi:hypothetical protein ES703_90308 [subsurface metagenome]